MTVEQMIMDLAFRCYDVTINLCGQDVRVILTDQTNSKCAADEVGESLLAALVSAHREAGKHEPTRGTEP